MIARADYHRHCWHYNLPPKKRAYGETLYKAVCCWCAELSTTYASETTDHGEYAESLAE